MGLENYTPLAGSLWDEIISSPEILKNFSRDKLLALSIGDLKNQESDRFYRVSIGQFSDLNPSSLRGKGHIATDYHPLHFQRNTARGYSPLSSDIPLDALAELELADLKESRRFFLILNGVVLREALTPTVLSWDEISQTPRYEEPNLECTLQQTLKLPPPHLIQQRSSFLPHPKK